MASILQFPGKLFAESPLSPQPASPSAEEAAFNRPRFGLNLGGRREDRPWEIPFTPAPLPSQIKRARASVDLQIAHISSRTRIHRLFTPAARTSTHPA